MIFVRRIILGGIFLVGLSIMYVLSPINANKNTYMLVDNKDLDIRFTKAEVDGENEKNLIISNDGKTINFGTIELKGLGDKSNINFDVTNFSNRYDVDLSIECTKGDNEKYYQITTQIENEVGAKETRSGKLEFIKTKTPLETIQDEFACTLNVITK